MKRSNKVLLTIISVLSIVVILLMLFAKNINERNKEMENYSKYAIIGKENIIVVYDDKLALKIPFEIQIDKNITYADLVKQKNYDKVVDSLNLILPEKISVYRRIKFGNVDLDIKNWINLPETSIDGKRYILTTNLNALFKEYLQIYESRDMEFTEMILDILNAQGKSGYARTTGEKLKKKFGLRYNAANYEKLVDENYLVVNEISKEKLEKIVMELNGKYFRVKKDFNMPTLANAIIVLGKEQNIKTNIEIVGNKIDISKIEKQLKESDYKNLKIKIKQEVQEKSIIYYNEDDYFTAYKIGEKIGIKELEKSEDLKNTIIIKLDNKK
ncbi:MAG: LytR C-terminal domain-containing protein [Fusobacteriaceae bacterium]